MMYFDRTRRCSIVFLSLSVLFFIFAVIAFINSQFTEILEYNYTNDMRGSLLTVIFLLISVMLLVAGIALRRYFKMRRKTFSGLTSCCASWKRVTHRTN